MHPNRLIVNLKHKFVHVPKKLIEYGCKPQLNCIRKVCNWINIINKYFSIPLSCGIFFILPLTWMHTCGETFVFSPLFFFDSVFNFLMLIFGNFTFAAKLLNCGIVNGTSSILTFESLGSTSSMRIKLLLFDLSTFDLEYDVFICAGCCVVDGHLFGGDGLTEDSTLL